MTGPTRGTEAGARGTEAGARITGAGTRDAGAGSVLVIGMIALVVILAAALGVLGQAQVARAEAQAAADLAALAGAAAVWTPATVRVAPDAAGPLTACAVVEEVAARNRTVVVDCRQDGDEVRVVVHKPSAVGTAVGRARAGPVPSP